MTGQITAYIGLGSNLGDRQRSIDEALEMLGRDACIAVRRVSEIAETIPLHSKRQPRYLNGVAELETTVGAEALLDRLQAVEAALGRERQGKWASRTIDLDLLLYGRQIMDSPRLTVPHPEMHLRSFVLEGLRQLEPELVHPRLEEPMAVLADRLNGESFAPNPEAPQLVSVAGNIGVGKTTLTNKLGAVLGAPVLLEPYDTNPYMPEVYAGKNELALDSQLYFLVNRAEQLERSALSPSQIVLTDYVFDKELIYARRLLNGHQLDLYERIYWPFAERAVSPVAVIYMHDSPEHCLERIHRRNRPYEQKITVDFLRALDQDYEKAFAQWKRCPVLRVPATSLGSAGDDAAAVKHIATQIKSYAAMPARTPVSD